VYSFSFLKLLGIFGDLFIPEALYIGIKKTLSFENKSFSLFYGKALTYDEVAVCEEKRKNSTVT
jgi:hypothetical protein